MEFLTKENRFRLLLISALALTTVIGVGPKSILEPRIDRSPKDETCASFRDAFNATQNGENDKRAALDIQMMKHGCHSVAATVTIPI